MIISKLRRKESIDVFGLNTSYKAAMKKIKIHLDYRDLDQIYIEKKIHFYVGEKRIHATTLYTEMKDPTDQTKTIPIRGPLVYTTEFEIEDEDTLILCLEDKGLDGADWGHSCLDMALTNILYAMGAVFFRIKGHYNSYFLQSCYSFAKRYCFVSNGDATFNLKFCPYTKEKPISGMKYENSSDVYIEEYYRKIDYQRDWEIYKKSIVLDSAITLLLVALELLLCWMLGLYRAGAVAAIVFGLSAIIYPIRNLLIGKKQFQTLKDNEWNLDFFVNH